ncbi:MAG: hypothetical protein ACOX9R_19940 [Armatimonadota bacterium]|jgi:hypothetical protein
MMITRMPTTVLTTALLAAALAVAPAVGPALAASVVLDDFEAGVGAWRTNDAEAAGQQPSEICGIYTVARQANGRTEQAALIEFLQARNTWASVSLPVNGTVWVRENVGQISMWLRGDGSDNTVDLILRSRVGEDRRDVSYVYKLPLKATEWQHRAIRLFAFRDADGNSPGAEAVRNAYLLQFVRTGSWPTITLYVDELMAEPIPGAVELPPEERPLSVRLDFTRTVGRMRGQVGVNLGEDVAPILDQPAASAALARALEQLTPCVARIRLSDFYDRRIADYDLIRLNRAINWVTDTGARALVCLDPALLPTGDDGRLRPDPDFEAVALRLVALRRGGPHLRYYELFDRPLLSGQFESVEALTAAYNNLAQRVLAADPEARVGGPGFAAAWEDNVREFVRGASTLHFLSLHFNAAHNPAVGGQTLFDAALRGASADLPEQLTLTQIRALVDDRRPMPELFVTSLAMNSARRPDGTAADDRILDNFGAAWTAAAMLASSTPVDKFLHYKLFGTGWGLTNPRGTPNQAYHAAWLVHTYAPRGATLGQLLNPTDDLLIVAVWTPTASNAFVVYAGEDARAVVIEAVGVGDPLLVRERRLTSDGRLNMVDLPNSRSQSIQFEGPGVSVIQFVHAD